MLVFLSRVRWPLGVFSVESLQSTMTGKVAVMLAFPPIFQLGAISKLGCIIEILILSAMVRTSG
jgi:hypothetical protein